MRFLSNWLAIITKSGDESKSFPIQQFKMNGRTGDAYIAAPYGMHYNLPADQPALNVSPDGTILMGIDPIGRIKVEESEVVFYHPVTGSKTHYKNNGDIDIETEADLNAVCKNANITASGDINATATGDITALCDNLNATATTKATITAPNIAFIGIVDITGTFKVNGKDIGEFHGHTQGIDSANDVQQNTGGVV